MKQAELAGILAFLNGAEQLKQTLRSAHTSNGRQESTAEHTWRLCLMVMLFEKQFSDIDMLKLLKMCIIHDLGEAISGDIAAVDQIEGCDKGAQERIDLLELMAPLPQDLQDEILLLWDEYEHASSPEAMMAKAFDKLETMLQHTQGMNPPDFDYGFNLNYGKRYTDNTPLTAQIRTLIDIDTARLAKDNSTL